MNSIILSIILCASTLVSAADITFATGANCTGEPLYGGKNISAVPCYDISFYESAQSVVLSHVNHDQVVRFYTDAFCQDELFNTSEDTCYQSPARISSFLIEQIQLRNDQDKSFGHNSTDLVPYNDFRLSIYKGLSLTDPYNIDLRYTDAYVGIATGLTGSGASLYSFIYGCATTGGMPLNIAACAAVPLATVLGFISGIFITRALSSSGRAVTEAINMATGVTSNVRRSDSDDVLVFDYLSELLNGSEFSDAAHVGHLEREFYGVKQVSPMYEINPLGEEKWHLAAFYDNTTSQVVHHIHAAAETEAVLREHPDQLTSRGAPYRSNGIRWATGGLDFVYCAANSDAPSSGFSPANAFYNALYDQITCLKTFSQLQNARNFLFTLYNEEGTSKGDVFIAPYGGDKSYGALTCPQATTYVNQDCILA